MNEGVIDYEELFLQFDEDDDGFLNQNELESLMIALGYQINVDEMSEMFKDLDVDGDNKISYKEFQFLLNKRTRDLDIIEEYTEAFKLFDKEKQGKIKIENLTELL